MDLEKFWNLEQCAIICTKGGKRRVIEDCEAPIPYIEDEETDAVMVNTGYVRGRMKEMAIVPKAGSIILYGRILEDLVEIDEDHKPVVVTDTYTNKKYTIIITGRWSKCCYDEEELNLPTTDSSCSEVFKILDNF